MMHNSPGVVAIHNIDLVQTVQAFSGKILDAMKRPLDPWLGKPQRDVKEG
jgi:hypothetical protein